jgi:hypothetical protein
VVEHGVLLRVAGGVAMAINNLLRRPSRCRGAFDRRRMAFYKWALR